MNFLLLLEKHLPISKNVFIFLAIIFFWAAGYLTNFTKNSVFVSCVGVDFEAILVKKKLEKAQTGDKTTRLDPRVISAWLITTPQYRLAARWLTALQWDSPSKMSVS